MTLDVQPELVRLSIKGKLFQLVLPETIHSDKSVAERSRASGKLFLRMPKEVGEIVIKANGRNTTATNPTTPKVGSRGNNSLRDTTYPEDLPDLI